MENKVIENLDRQIKFCEDLITNGLDRKEVFEHVSFGELAIQTQEAAYIAHIDLLRQKHALLCETLKKEHDGK